MVMVAVACIVLDAAEVPPIAAAAAADVVVVVPPLRAAFASLAVGVFVLLLFPPLPGNNEEVGILSSFVLESAIL